MRLWFCSIVAIIPLFLTALPSLPQKSVLPQLFPNTPTEISKLEKRFAAQYEASLKDFVAMGSKRGKNTNALPLWDRMEGEYLYAANLMDAIILCHPDPAVRKQAIRSKQRIHAQRKELLGAHPAFYDILANLEVSEEKQYYFSRVREKLRQDGFHLSSMGRKALHSKFAEAVRLSTLFQTNISEDARFLVLDPSSLQGLSEEFLSTLPRNEQGAIIVHGEYATYLHIAQQCTNESTRQKISELFLNKGFPKNQAILSKYIKIQQDIATQLGYRSSAHREMETEMIGSPEKALSFLYALSERISQKAAQEHTTLVNMLPKEIQCTKDGKVHEWDYPYLREHTQKHINQISSSTISNYFPLKHTMKHLFQLYENFFGVTIQASPVQDGWSEDLFALEVRERGNDFLHGYVLLDLHPRANKYHHACMVPLLPAYTDTRVAHPATALIVCNLPQHTPEKQALLTLREVTTFAHELGHALHHLFARSDMASATLDALPIDYVELPSQLFEQWLSQPDVLKTLSHHHITGKPLSDELIDTVIQSGQFSTGLEYQKQTTLAFVALSLFSGTSECDPHATFSILHEQFFPYIARNQNGHQVTSFSHLTGYGSRYYGYLWSRMLCCDVFAKICEEGRTDAEVGKKLRRTLLTPGPMKDPHEMVESFLGRPPSNEPFFKAIGV